MGFLVSKESAFLKSSNDSSSLKINIIYTYSLIFYNNPDYGYKLGFKVQYQSQY